MVQEIDFLKSRKQAGLKQLRQRRFLKIGSLIFLISYCLVAGGIFAFWLYLDQANQGVEKEITLKKEQIVELKSIESLQILLKQRLSLLTSLFSQKTPAYSQVFLSFEQMTTAFDGLSLTEFGLLEDKKKMVVAGTAINAIVLGNFLEELKRSTEMEKHFAKISLNSMSRQAGGSYNFSLALDVK